MFTLRGVLSRSVSTVTQTRKNLRNFILYSYLLQKQLCLLFLAPIFSLRTPAGKPHLPVSTSPYLPPTDCPFFLPFFPSHSQLCVIQTSLISFALSPKSFHPPPTSQYSWTFFLTYKKWRQSILSHLPHGIIVRSKNHYVYEKALLVVNVTHRIKQFLLEVV